MFMLMFLLFLSSILPLSPGILSLPNLPLFINSSDCAFKKRTHVYHLFAVKQSPYFNFNYTKEFQTLLSQSTARNTRKHKSLCIAILSLSTHDVLDIFYSSLFNVLNAGWTFKLIKTKRMKNNELHSQCTVNQCTNREKVLKEICWLP